MSRLSMSPQPTTWVELARAVNYSNIQKDIDYLFRAPHAPHGYQRQPSGPAAPEAAAEARGRRHGYRLEEFDALSPMSRDEDLPATIELGAVMARAAPCVSNPCGPTWYDPASPLPRG